MKQSILRSIGSISLVFLFIACNKPTEEVTNKASTQKSADAGKKQDSSKSSSSELDNVAKQYSIGSCSLSKNGNSRQADSAEACEGLLKDSGISLEEIAADDSNASILSVHKCSISNNGKEQKGESKEECEKLLKEAGIELGDIIKKSADSKDLPSGSEEKYECSVNINGVEKKGHSKAECDALQSSLDLPKIPDAKDLPSGGEEKYECSVNINGVEKKGHSKAECDALQAAIVVPNNPAPNPSGSNNAVQCSYNVNGVEKKGNSQAECDALKKQYGF